MKNGISGMPLENGGMVRRVEEEGDVAVILFDSAAGACSVGSAHPTNQQDLSSYKNA